jgi:hypothetical protein
MGLCDVETHIFLDSPLIDGCEVVSLSSRPRPMPQENSDYSFLLQAESNPSHSAVAEKFSNIIRNQWPLF